MNEVRKEVLNKAVIKAAEDIIETKGVAGRYQKPWNKELELWVNLRSLFFNAIEKLIAGYLIYFGRNHKVATLHANESHLSNY